MGFSGWVILVVSTLVAAFIVDKINECVERIARRYIKHEHTIRDWMELAEKL